MELNIRQANTGDATILQKFVANLFAESLDVIFKRDVAPTVQDEIDLIEKLEASPNSCLLLAFEKEELVGILDLHGFSGPQKQHTAGFGMSVAKAYRNRGVGRALIEALIQYAQSNEHLSRLELEVLEINKFAIQLYETMHFRHEGRKRAAVRVNGKFVDVLTLALLLK